MRSRKAETAEPGVGGALRDGLLSSHLGKTKGPGEPPQHGQLSPLPRSLPLLACPLPLCVLTECFHATLLSGELSASPPLQSSRVDKRPLRLIVYDRTVENRLPFLGPPLETNIWFLLIYWRQTLCRVSLRISSH